MIDVEHPDKGVYTVDMGVNADSGRIVKISPVTSAIAVDLHGHPVVPGIRDGSRTSTAIINFSSDDVPGISYMYSTYK